MSERITAERLELVPLEVKDAEEMVGVLGDMRLHAFIGGKPLALDELRERYARLVAGSGNPDEAWLNWIVRRRADSQPVGTVKATVTKGGRKAHVAWVIGIDWQNRGYASEAARALVGWLRERGSAGRPSPHPPRPSSFGCGHEPSRPRADQRCCRGRAGVAVLVTLLVVVALEPVTTV